MNNKITFLFWTTLVRFNIKVSVYHVNIIYIFQCMPGIFQCYHWFDVLHIFSKAKVVCVTLNKLVINVTTSVLGDISFLTSM